MLAVNWPPQAPGAGRGDVLELGQLLVGHLAGGVGADRLEDVLDRDVLALEAARARSSRRRASGSARRGGRGAITQPGIVLSQPESATTPSNMWPRATSSIESAITSRLTSEAFMPSVPIVMPSETAIGVELHRRAAGGADAVLDPLGEARAGGSCTASSRSRCWRCRRSAARSASSSKPMPLRYARAAARSGPSRIARLRSAALGLLTWRASLDGVRGRGAGAPTRRGATGRGAPGRDRPGGRAGACSRCGSAGLVAGERHPLGEHVVGVGQARLRDRPGQVGELDAVLAQQAAGLRARRRRSACAGRSR